MTNNNNITSWGLTGQKNSRIQRINWRNEKLPEASDGVTFLPYGNGRSYGDSCLNKEGISLDVKALNHLISFDPKTHILRCEGGVLLADILHHFVPRGWFLSVTPGTQYVTIGGAIANDVHGKNHHRRGSFGNHVIRLALLRSDGQTLICSRTQNADLFHATIGGLGLTGLILWAEIMLMPIDAPCMHVETSRFESLEEFFSRSAESAWKFEYTVAWLDCAASDAMGRGIFIRANHCSRVTDSKKNLFSKGITLPFNLPGWLINNFSSKVFNSIYFNAHPPGVFEQTLDYNQFFYPLDKVRHWNRLYGKKGFFQYQCVVPVEQGTEHINALLKMVKGSAIASPLAVLKVFGEIESTGMLSFPRHGVTLAMDFPNRGSHVLTLFDQLDAIVAEAGGAVYPAKDARMSAENFKRFFPACHDFSRYVDPAFSSTFWRRVMG